MTFSRLPKTPRPTPELGDAVVLGRSTHEVEYISDGDVMHTVESTVQHLKDADEFQLVAVWIDGGTVHHRNIRRTDGEYGSSVVDCTITPAPEEDALREVFLSFVNEIGITCTEHVGVHQDTSIFGLGVDHKPIVSVVSNVTGEMDLL